MLEDEADGLALQRLSLFAVECVHRLSGEEGTGRAEYVLSTPTARPRWQFGWLEVTDKCNTYCRGCYRINGMQGHKSLEQIKEEIDLLKRWRNCDNISIAGGEPLIHPNILEIVAYTRSLGIKPLILTNGIRIENDIQFIRELKAAGIVGFTFHIDSEQNRPHWKGKSEYELFELRQHYADMVHSVGGLFASFGMTVYPGNLDFVPEMVKWANRNIDRVHGLVLIGFRNAVMEGDFDYYAQGNKVDLKTSYVADSDAESYLTSEDIYNKIREHFPHFTDGHRFPLLPVAGNKGIITENIELENKNNYHFIISSKISEALFLKLMSKLGLL